MLDPPPGDWLYFVADGSGGHVFSNTYEEHQGHVANWRRMEKAAPAPAPDAAAPPVAETPQ